MKKLSLIALEKCLPTIELIKEHPFNKELADGSLPMSKFAYYVEQDTLFLRDFTRSLAFLASKVPPKFTGDFLSFSEYILMAEQEVVHNFFRKTYQLEEIGKLTPATLSYTSYILYKSSMAPVEVGIASVLPCFWIYKIVGDSITKNTDKASQNPYQQWIDAYSGQGYSDTVQRVIDIFDEIALSTSDEVQQLMLDAFYKGTVLEWHFWNDAYNKTAFDSLC
ncbi:MAG: TenA family protein [Chthoniobacterales bacterium]